VENLTIRRNPAAQWRQQMFKFQQLLQKGMRLICRICWSRMHFGKNRKGRYRNIKLHQHHQVFNIAYLLHCLYDNSLSKYQFRRHNDCIAWFAEELKNLAYNVKIILSVSMADFMRNDWIKFNSATHYHMYEKPSQKMTHGYAIITITPGDIEALRIQIAII